MVPGRGRLALVPGHEGPEVRDVWLQTGRVSDHVGKQGGRSQSRHLPYGVRFGAQLFFTTRMYDYHRNSTRHAHHHCPIATTRQTTIPHQPINPDFSQNAGTTSKTIKAHFCLGHHYTERRTGPAKTPGEREKNGGSMSLLPSLSKKRFHR